MMQKKNAKKNWGLVYLLAIILVLVCAGLSYSFLKDKGSQSLPQSSSAEKKQETGVEARDFVMEGAMGNEVSLKDFMDKPVVLNFWASWCPPCRAEMPLFDTTYREYKDKVNFIFLNVTDGLQETKETAQEFLKNKDFSFPVYYDTNLEGVSAFQVAAYPTTVLIKEGKVVQTIQGMVMEGDLEAGMAKLLDGGESK